NSSFTEQMQRYSYPDNNIANAFSESASLQYYYPVAPDIYDLIYTRWISTVNHHDQMWMYFRFTNTASAWGTTDCAADNSDPAPVDERYFIYSRDNNTGLGAGQYELYLGQMTGGGAWLLPSAVNTGGSASLIGANYTNAR